MISRRLIKLYLATLVVIGVVVRLWNINKASIWHDEGYTMMLAPMGPIEIIERTARDVHPPLYYLILHYWLLVFGNSEIAARSLSLAFMVGVIPLTYLVLKRLWNTRAAMIGALLVTSGPFLVRYSQEARMYGMVAFLLLLATYFLVRAIQDKRRIWWVLYAVAIAASLYTHYYSIFMIATHWIYMATQTRRPGTGILSGRWWLANIGAALLFLPWVPSAWGQFTRVQAAFWIPAPTELTMPNTLFHFLLNHPAHQLRPGLKIAIALGFLAIVGVTLYRARGKRRTFLLLSMYMLLAPVAVFLLSFQRPIYVDRYFVFSAVGFYMVLAVILSRLRFRLLAPLTAAFVVMFGFGIHIVHTQATHDMRTIGNYVTSNFQEGDAIVSGELYTYFDFSYYNLTGTETLLWSKRGVNGYGETSLIYDRQEELVVRKLGDVKTQTGRIWLVGKTGNKEYYEKIPPNWKAVGAKKTARSSAVQLYEVQGRSNLDIAVK